MGVLVREGLERLAFGGIADAVKLVCLEGQESWEQLDNLDLFNVAKFKKTKDGFEMELFDRQRALEALEKLNSGESGGETAAMLYEAITQGAAAISGKKGNG